MPRLLALPARLVFGGLLIIDGCRCSCSTCPVIPGDPGPSDVTLYVDTYEERHAISPLICGINQCTTTSLTTFCRGGGNRWSAYNWELNLSNSGDDPVNNDGDRFANDRNLVGGTAPGGAVATRMAVAKTLGVPILITIPATGRRTRMKP